MNQDSSGRPQASQLLGLVRCLGFNPLDRSTSLLSAIFRLASQLTVTQSVTSISDSSLSLQMCVLPWSMETLTLSSDPPSPHLSILRKRVKCLTGKPTDQNRVLFSRNLRSKLLGNRQMTQIIYGLTGLLWRIVTL